MRGSKALGHLYRDVEELARGIRSRHRRAFHKLHDKIIRTNVVKLADIWVIQRRDGTGLTRKTVAELGGGSLNRNYVVQSCIARLPHLPHPPRAEKLKNFVGAEFVAGRNRHLYMSALSLTYAIRFDPR